MELAEKLNQILITAKPCLCKHLTVVRVILGMSSVLFDPTIAENAKFYKIMMTVINN